MNNTEIESGKTQINNDQQELFLDELADLFNPQQQLTESVPKMARAVNSNKLSFAFVSHLPAAQKTEHYEMAFCGSGCASPEKMGDAGEIAIFTDPIDEEKAADDTLAIYFA